MKTLAIEGCASELIHRLESVQPDSPRQWGRMNAHQMVCHVADACRMALGETHVSDSSTVVTRTLIKWLALHVPLRWRPGIVTRPEIDQYVAGTKPGDFHQDRDQVESLLRTIAARTKDTNWPVHPIFGTLSHTEWLRWAYLHTDHHLRQFGA